MGNTPAETLIYQVLDGLSISSKSRLRWFGVQQARNGSRNKVRRHEGADDPELLKLSLQDLLYFRFYCPGRAVAVIVPSPSSVAADMEFVKRLTQSIRGTGTWEPGWRIVRQSARGKRVANANLEITATCDEVLPDPLDPSGPSVFVRQPNGSPELWPGYYLVSGDQQIAGETTEITRTYFHLTPRGALRFSRIAFDSLNSLKIPFQFKLPSSLSGYWRCDAGVLYSRKQDYAQISEIVHLISTRIEFGPDTPAFTKRLGNGVALAESPSDGQSFGRHRCGVLAAALTKAHQASERSRHGRMELVREEFDRNGLRLNAPFLSPGSPDTYQPFPTLRRRTSPHPSKLGKSPLAAAVEIAAKLAREAFWDGPHCNWLGNEIAEISGGRFESTLISRALDGSLYAGTAGIALFMAEVYRVTGDAKFGTVAAGAMHQSIEWAAPSGGLFTGTAGVALCSAWVGRALVSDYFVKTSEKLAERLGGAAETMVHDMMGGHAGAIVALLSISLVARSPHLVELAFEIGEILLANARWSARGCSWGQPDAKPRNDLTGFSHGTAGIACALMELFRVRGDRRFAIAAAGAFEYERSWFDFKAENWPHLDHREHVGHSLDNPWPFVAHWCHGAPGMALSRLRTGRILGRLVDYEPEIAAALRTTRSTIREWLADPNGANYSLCHGLAGNADILLYNAMISGPDAEEGYSLAKVVGSEGIRRHHKRATWPSGSGAGEHPSLMLGLAGTGYFLLRLNDLKLPSVLIIEPEAVYDWSERTN